MAKQATLKGILQTAAYFRQHPTGTVTPAYGIYWTRAEFRRWFIDCLNRRISQSDKPQTSKVGGEYFRLCKWFGIEPEQVYCESDAQFLYNEAIQAIRFDRDIVTDHIQRRIIRRGQNIFKTGYFKTKYPDINSTSAEY